MKKQIVFFALLFLTASLAFGQQPRKKRVLPSPAPTQVPGKQPKVSASCPPFQASYSWSSGFAPEDLIQDLNSYLNDPAYNSNLPCPCPAPSTGNGDTNIDPYVSEIVICEWDTSVPGNCNIAEYSAYPVNSEYPPTVITGCELKVIADQAINKFKYQNAPYCSCQNTDAKIARYEAHGTTNFNNGMPPRTRFLYITATYRCCGLCN